MHNISLVTVTSPLSLVNRQAFPMSPLNHAAVTTGTSTMQTQGGGQMLIGIAGRGWYQEEGKAAVEIPSRHSDPYPCQRKTLARCSRQQLVRPPCIRTFRKKTHPMNG